LNADSEIKFTVGGKFQMLITRSEKKFLHMLLEQ